jgi:phosphatidylinositol-3-phosphatase
MNFPLLRSRAKLGALVAAAGLAAAAIPAAVTPAAAATKWKLPPVGHVFVINLENEGYATTFGAGSPAPYLAKTLRAKGNLLTNYYGIGHNSLDNYQAQISGQGPNPQTQADCQIFTDFIKLPVSAANGQAVGQGCVYPSSVKTIADQLTSAHKTWRGYMEDMGNTPSRESRTCGHPAIGSQDKTQSATAADQYAARHNPFVYFHSLLDSGACAKNDVPLTALTKDLSSVSTTRNLSYITPNLCDDGHDSPCASGKPGGLVSANAWLKTWVPRILNSPAFKKDGLLVITFDESDGPNSDSTACCGETAVNTPAAGITGAGGGRVGAVLISRWIKPGSTTSRAYNHYSLLASIEDLMHLPLLGYAGKSGLPHFAKDVYTAS